MFVRGGGGGGGGVERLATPITLLGEVPGCNETSCYGQLASPVEQHCARGKNLGHKFSGKV